MTDHIWQAKSEESRVSELEVELAEIKDHSLRETGTCTRSWSEDIKTIVRLEVELARTREALTAIAEGRWNSDHPERPVMDHRQFARSALSSPARSPKETE